MFLVLMSAGGELMLSAGHQYETAPRPAPEGWFVYPIKDANHPDQQTRECFNYSRNTWRVSLEQSAVKIVKLARGAAEQPPMPPLLRVEPRIMRAHRTSVKFADSWLLGFDGGEFGGGLWVSNLDGSQTKEIWNQDIRSITPVGDKILALSGLAHMSLDSGDALVLSPPRGINAPVERVIHLDGAPLATTEDADGSILIVTTRSLSRITDAWELQRLVSLADFVRFQYPNSMIRESDGTIYIGMQMLVLRLLPPEYTEEWLLPDECRKFYLRGTDCECRP